MEQRKNYKLAGIMALILVLLPTAIWINQRALLNLIKAPAAITYDRMFSAMYVQGKYGMADNPPSDYIALVQRYIDNPAVKKIVALGCLDWKYMQEINIPSNKTYIGYDVVSHAIAVNNAEYSDDNVFFDYVENIKDLLDSGVSGDLLIVKDFLEYRTNKEINHFLHKILPKFKYAIITNIINDNPKRTNKDIVLGESRAIDLLQRPFNLTHAKVVLEYVSKRHSAHRQIILYSRN